VLVCARAGGGIIVLAESSKLNGPGLVTERIAFNAGSEQERIANQL